MNESPAFYEQMHTIREPYRRLAAAIEATVGPVSSVRDIGCGVGHVVQWFAERGHDARGWDLPLAIKLARDDARPLLDTSMAEWPSADLVICTETAEHVPEADAEAFLIDVARATRRLLVWSAAPPGQEWEGHVNCQPAAYWLERLARHDLIVDRDRTDNLRRVMRQTHAQHEHCAASFYVFRRSTA